MISSRKITNEDLPLIKDWLIHSPDWLREEGLLVNEVDGLRIQAWMSLYEKYQGEWLIWSDSSRYIGMTYHVSRAPSNGRPWIGMVVVAPDKRNEGIGRVLLERITECLNQLGEKVVYIGCPFERTNWMQFLGRCGFEQIGMDLLESGKKYIKMAKAIEIKNRG